MTKVLHNIYGNSPSENTVKSPCFLNSVMNCCSSLVNMLLQTCFAVSIASLCKVGTEPSLVPGVAQRGYIFCFKKIVNHFSLCSKIHCIIRVAMKPFCDANAQPTIHACEVLNTD